MEKETIYRLQVVIDFNLPYVDRTADKERRALLRTFPISLRLDNMVRTAFTTRSKDKAESMKRLLTSHYQLRIEEWCNKNKESISQSNFIGNDEDGFQYFLTFNSSNAHISCVFVVAEEEINEEWNDLDFLMR